MSASVYPLKGHERNQYLDVSIERVDAPRVAKQIGGKTRNRVCFFDPTLSDPKYRIQMVCQGCFSFMSGAVAVAFSASINGQMGTVLLNLRSLQERWGVSEALIRRAERLDCLKMLSFGVLGQSHFERKKTSLEIPQVGLHLSAKDYPMLRGPLYLGDKFCYQGIRDSLINRGTFAKVKRAVACDGRIVARRIWDTAIYRAEEIANVLRKMETLYGRPGIIDLLGTISYVSQSGKHKIVTFHTLFDRDLCDLLNQSEDESVTPYRKWCWARDLFIGLHSLHGASCDMKPENLLVKGDALVIADLEFHVDESYTGYWEKGTKEWAAPEVLRREKVNPRNLDVWAAGIILYYLFLFPFEKNFPWHIGDLSKGEILQRMNQVMIHQQIDASDLSPAVKELLKNMIVMDPSKRWTVEECMDYFQKNIPMPPPPSPEISEIVL